MDIKVYQQHPEVDLGEDNETSYSEKGTSALRHSSKIGVHAKYFRYISSCHSVKKLLEVEFII